MSKTEFQINDSRKKKKKKLVVTFPLTLGSGSREGLRSLGSETAFTSVSLARTIEIPPKNPATVLRFFVCVFFFWECQKEGVRSSSWMEFTVCFQSNFVCLVRVAGTW